MTTRPATPRRDLNQDQQRLKRTRIALGLSLNDVRDRCGLTISALSELENGRASARPATLARLAAAYGCEITDLMPAEAES